VLGNGRVLEFDTPQALLSDRNSQFNSFVKQTGISEAEHLRTLANNARSNIEKNQDIFLYNETLLENDHETDSLIST
ncbi:unnamed protein product, partial [Rotaria sp. Silwood1]